VKLPDANVLLYAIDADSPHHDSARDWLEQALNGADTIAFSWTVLLAVIRIATNPSAYAEPLSADDAIAIVEEWLAAPTATVAHPTPRHAEILRDLLRATGTAGNLTSDAHLAALALEHNGEVISADRDFGRFPGLRWTNPVA
jgi:hypothetical protein